ncbi:MAG: membrane associated rhomboid family serine protease, partial [Salibacteraceae bacterium]
MSQLRTGGFQMLPPVVKNLLIINILMFLATQVTLNLTGFNLNSLLGLHWPGSSAFQWYQPITYMFMHGNFQHILFNMFAVWMFGNAIENIWGARRFLTFYLITGLGAALMHYGIVYFETIQDFNYLIDSFLSNPNSQTLSAFFKDYKIQIDSHSSIETSFNSVRPYIENVLSGSNNTSDIENVYEFMGQYKSHFLSSMNVVGASGSLFGILLAFGMMFPNAELYLMFIPIPIKAKYFVAGYGAFELYSGIAGSSDGIAHFAHLGGLITGFILIKLWQRFD